MAGADLARRKFLAVLGGVGAIGCATRHVEEEVPWKILFPGSNPQCGTCLFALETVDYNPYTEEVKLVHHLYGNKCPHEGKIAWVKVPAGDVKQWENLNSYLGKGEDPALLEIPSSWEVFRSISQKYLKG